MAKFAWYWHRLRAMSAREMALHARKKFRHLGDARRLPNWASVKPACSGAFPKLPKPEEVPPVLREALQLDVENILAGRWKAFGHFELKVDDPPNWHCDYLVGKNLATTESAFRLNYRELPAGADIKLIWELSRWHELVRLAMAAYVLGDERAAQTCLRWLEDWVKHNPPYCGWNWTSALEVGMRLIQFTWIDALLEGAGARTAVSAPASNDPGTGTRLSALRCAILPPHGWFAWRYKSFGSSANNHLLGELAGLIVATARWPALAHWGTSLAELQTRWEQEVWMQFAEDGGNKEQALNYQLFSFELCWQARKALLMAGKKISTIVEQRLDSAARFFWEVQARREPWDYGDSDSAFATPFFTQAQTALMEWRDWISRRNTPGALDYWLGESPGFSPPLGWSRPIHAVVREDWWYYKHTGIAVCESGFWWLRWDLSPLGYLKTAAHGHLDALHLSIWFKGVAIVIDPGTGAYFADQNLRSWLASCAAHNGPCPDGGQFPKRLGPFLWSHHHPVPDLKLEGRHLLGILNLPGCQLKRRISHSEASLIWRVEDQCVQKNGAKKSFSVRWQFAPGARVKILAKRKFVLNRAGVSINIEVGDDWEQVKLVETESDRDDDAPLAGVVSPAFRKACFAPYLLLTAPAGEKPCVFRTTFLASAAS